MAEAEGSPTIDALLADQRRRSLGGKPFRVEGYLDRFPDLLADPEGLLDLIYNEILLREGRGESPGLDEYRARFPGLTEALGDLFEVHDAIESGGSHPTLPPDSGAGADPLDGVPTLPPARPVEPPPTWPTLDGYEIVDVLGSGGMGVVFLASDRRRGVPVAVKTMRQADAASLSRFKQEFRALLDVSHPNLVTLHELISDGGAWFIVMERVDGTDFLSHVRGGRDTTARLRAATLQLAEGLEALHQAGKLHRDIKPSNVMVTAAGRVVLMDFGLIATTARRGDVTHRPGARCVGTVGVHGARAGGGPRALAGERLVQRRRDALRGADRPPAVRRAGRSRSSWTSSGSSRPRPDELAPGVPDDLNALCVELLRRDPHARPLGREVLARLGASGVGRRRPAHSSEPRRAAVRRPRGPPRGPGRRAGGDGGRADGGRLRPRAVGGRQERPGPDLPRRA